MVKGDLGEVERFSDVPAPRVPEMERRGRMGGRMSYLQQSYDDDDDEEDSDEEDELEDELDLWHER